MMEKLRLTQFGGETTAFGKPVTFDFAYDQELMDEAKDLRDGSSEFVIRGLTMDEALRLLELAQGGDLGQVSVRQEMPGGADPDRFARVAVDPWPATVPSAAQVVAGTVGEQDEVFKQALDALVSKHEEEMAPAKEPTPSPAVEDADLGEHGVQMDLAKMNSFTKLRELIEYAMGCGHQTSQRLYDALLPLRVQVKVLQGLDAKGNFERKLERAIDTVLVDRPGA